MPIDIKKALWRCPKCGARLVTRNMQHSCGIFTLKQLFAKSEPQVYRIFKKFRSMVNATGRVTMIPQKTRVAFMVRVRFAGAYPRKSYLLCAFALPRRCTDKRIFKIEQYAPHFVGHFMRIDSEGQLDAQVQRWLNEAREVGTREALAKKNTRSTYKAH
jgi:hypothetical protein